MRIVPRMPKPSERFPDNAPGDWYVDRSCIDCGTCQRVAPATFARSDGSSGNGGSGGGAVGPRNAPASTVKAGTGTPPAVVRRARSSATGRKAAAGPAAARPRGDAPSPHGDPPHSYVAVQPRDGEELLRAGMALLACPVGAIGAPSRTDLRPARDEFPEEVAPGVHALGYSSGKALGAAAWLVVRPDGNVLVDVPRFARPLVERVDALGGVAWIVLTHAGGAGEHAAWARQYGARRVLHEADLALATAEVETRWTGSLRLADDLRLVEMPGYTPGSAVLLHAEATAFTGGLVGGDGASGLTCPRAHRAWSAARLRTSLEHLGELPFTTLHPSFGASWAGHDGDARRAALVAAAADLDAAARRYA